MLSRSGRLQLKAHNCKVVQFTYTMSQRQTVTYFAVFIRIYQSLFLLPLSGHGKRAHWISRNVHWRQPWRTPGRNQRDGNVLPGRLCSRGDHRYLKKISRDISPNLKAMISNGSPIITLFKCWGSCRYFFWVFNKCLDAVFFGKQCISGSTNKSEPAAFACTSCIIEIPSCPSLCEDCFKPPVPVGCPDGPICDFSDDCSASKL